MKTQRDSLKYVEAKIAIINLAEVIWDAVIYERSGAEYIADLISDFLERRGVKIIELWKEKNDT